MRSSYDIEREMEEKFGKDFIKKMKSQKEEFERLQKELEEAKSFDEKVQEKANDLQKDFVRISDNHNIYPEETCGNYLQQATVKCITETLNMDGKKEKEIIKEYSTEALDLIEEDAKELLEEIKQQRDLL